MQCAVCSVQCTMCSVQCAVYSVHCAVCSVKCKLYSVQCAVYSVHCAFCSVQCAVSSMQCAVYSVHCAVCSVQCAVSSMQCAGSLARPPVDRRKPLLYSPIVAGPDETAGRPAAHSPEDLKNLIFIFNRPGIAGAVLQTPLSLIHLFSHSSFVEISSRPSLPNRMSWGT